jgi:hypothetical protein
MIGVLVRDKDAIQPIDIRIEELHPHVRRTVDQSARNLPLCVGSLNKERTPTPTVFRVIWIAGAPAKRDTRYAHGRAAAEDRKG